MTAGIQGVVFDWAGTTVDFGCFAPLEVFLEIFRSRGVDITLEEARAPMGMLKIDHIRAILKMERVAQAWEKKFGKPHTESDVEALYRDFEPALMKILPGYTDVLDGVLDVCGELRENGIKIGSTTGYTAAMMEIVASGAKRNGYAPDALVTAEEVSGGRPRPWMIFKNMEKLNVWPPRHIVKVGDTRSDIEEGLNAGVWSVGVVVGSSEMGLSREEYRALQKGERDRLHRRTERKYHDAGAHYIIETMADLPALIAKINRRMRKDEE